MRRGRGVSSAAMAGLLVLLATMAVVFLSLWGTTRATLRDTAQALARTQAQLASTLSQLRAAQRDLEATQGELSKTRQEVAALREQLAALTGPTPAPLPLTVVSFRVGAAQVQALAFQLRPGTRFEYAFDISTQGALYPAFTVHDPSGNMVATAPRAAHGEGGLDASNEGPYSITFDNSQSSFSATVTLSYRSGTVGP